MNALLCFTLGFIGGVLVTMLIVVASDRWKLWPKPRPFFAPRTQRLLLEVPFLDRRQLTQIECIVLGRPLYLEGDRDLQPDERIHLAITLERFGP
jgi:hypothetical protein